MKLVDFSPRSGEGFSTAGGDGVDAAAAASDDLCGGLEEAGVFEAVEQRVQGAGTDAVSVVGELLHHREAEDRLVRGMQQDVDADESEIEFPLFS